MFVSRLNITVIELHCPLDCVVTGSPRWKRVTKDRRATTQKTDQTKGVDSNLPGWHPKET